MANGKSVAISDFSYLDKLDVRNRTVEFPLRGITIKDITPTLIVSCATKENGPYWSEMLKYVERSRKAGRKSNNTTSVANQLDDNREQDRVLYPKHVIKGWTDVVSGDGARAEFDLGNCKAFVNSLPDWVFDRVRDFCSEPSNFADLDIDISEDTVKN